MTTPAPDIRLLRGCITHWVEFNAPCGKGCLFSANHKIEDVRRFAEQIAARAGERL